MNTEELSGSCLCGAVRYRATGEPVRFYHCHCSRCRKASGTGHASNLFLKGSLAVLAGADKIASYKVPEAERFTTVFCRTCGSRLPRFIEKVGMVLIPAGSLDTEPSITPQARIFVDSRTVWSCDATVLPEFGGSPV
jgi:hypothetical protein